MLCCLVTRNDLLMSSVESLVSLMLDAIDEEICESFCTKCEAREYVPATFYDPPEEHCPAEFMPGAPGCVKEEQYKELEEKAGEVITLLGETQEKNVYLSRLRKD